MYIIIIEGEKNQWTTEAVGCYPIPSLKTAGGKKLSTNENVTCPAWGEQYQASHEPNWSEARVKSH